jgi:hypothetical protein
MHYGVLKPVLVQKIYKQNLVIDGRQRVRAARRANEILTKQREEPILVPVMRRMGDEASMLGVMLSANIHHEELIEHKLPKLKKLLDRGTSETDCATACGVTTQTIKNWITLLESGPEVKTAVKEGLVSPTAGVQLASLPRAEQAEAVAEVTSEGKASTAKAQHVVRTRKQNAKKGTSEETIIPPNKRVLRKLLESEEFKELEIAPALMLKWFLGEVSSERLKGLTAVLRGLE